MPEKPSIHIPGVEPLIETFEEKRQRIAEEYRARAARPLARADQLIKSAKEVSKRSLPKIANVYYAESDDGGSGLPPPKFSDRGSTPAYRYVPPQIQPPRRRRRRDMGFDDVGRSPGFAP